MFFTWLILILEIVIMRTYKCINELNVSHFLLLVIFYAIQSNNYLFYQ
ncbi:hypothetical protein VIBNIENn2_920133 [Vibrio nigripulchritudo ENn2]|nr:hypothetical protein VIBNIENn2_920133 [Vibrio nigripulchritudo ENn2]